MWPVWVACRRRMMRGPGEAWRRAWSAELRRIWRQHPQEDVRRLALEVQCGRYAISELEAMAAEGYWYLQKEHATVADARKSLGRRRRRLMEELQRIGPITWQKRG